MALPRLVVTGASGFIGRRLLAGLKEQYQIIGMARRSQLRCGAPFHDNISWFQVDVGDRDQVTTAFRFVRSSGGADFVVHLAAHCDFSGDEQAEHWRSRVDGLRNVLEECRGLDLKRFVLASSVTACASPGAGAAVDEGSPPNGAHVEAATRRAGEQMLAEYDGVVPSCIVRFAAVFSDWCEYPPLYDWLEDWLSRSWRSRIVPGLGASAIPFLHAREIPVFCRRLLERIDQVGQREVLICGPSSTVSRLELYRLANLHFWGRHRRPLSIPGPLFRVGVLGRRLAGQVLGDRPSGRFRMVRRLGMDLRVDASRSQRKLGWQPRQRLVIERRVPFMIEHFKTDPVEWHRRNRAGLKDVRLGDNLLIHRLLEKRHDEIRTRFLEQQLLGPDSTHRFPNYRKVAPEILEWRFTVILRHLLNAVRTGEKGLFTAYCRDLAEKRFADGFAADEVCGTLELLNQTCVEVLREDPESNGLEDAISIHVATTFQFGCDQILETFEELGGEITVEGG